MTTSTLITANNTTLFTLNINVSQVKVFIILDGGILDVTRHVANICKYRLTKRDAIVTTGSGYNRGASIVERLSQEINLPLIHKAL